MNGWTRFTDRLKREFREQRKTPHRKGKELKRDNWGADGHRSLETPKALIREERVEAFIPNN